VLTLDRYHARLDEPASKQRPEPGSKLAILVEQPPRCSYRPCSGAFRSFRCSTRITIPV
jgi:hypothetical protein